MSIKTIYRKIRDSKIGKLLIEPYDWFVLGEYHVLSVFWRLKGEKRPSAEEAALVAENVTFIFKSFERQHMAKRLFRNIQKYYPKAKVIIADDSKKPLEIPSEYAQIIHLPFNIGLSRGLNQALEQVQTPYTMRMDDDELLTPFTKIETQLHFLMNHPEIDLSAVQLCTAPNIGTPQKAAKAYYNYSMKRAPKELKIPHMTMIDNCHCVCGKTPNTFLIRTEKYKELGYDDCIRMIDHHEFFYRAAGNLVACMDESAFVYHYHNRFDTHYMQYRSDYLRDCIYIQQKHGNNYS